MYWKIIGRKKPNTPTSNITCNINTLTSALSPQHTPYDVLPKLNYTDYYTEPAIQDLVVKERAEPGFCQHVKDFTDIQGPDLEVQFNNREVIIYMDDNKKPSVGQGFNKPAVVTLLNIKFFDKKTWQQYTEGPKKTRDQGAQFVSYDALKGEWKFKVNHF
ncbi:hypothetical protein ACHQM5_026453 [Ranunculus cassubicifolius]